MTESNLSTLDLFKIACISKTEFNDEEIIARMMDVIIQHETDIQEFLGILKKYRPHIYNRLLSLVIRKANANELIDEKLYQQKISCAFRNLNSHDPIIKKDIIRRISEELMKGEK